MRRFPARIRQWGTLRTVAALGRPDRAGRYGSYGCPPCRAANQPVAVLRDQFGDRLRYVFRHRPSPDSDIARRAAERVERGPDPDGARYRLWRRPGMIALLDGWFLPGGEPVWTDLIAIACSSP